MATHFLGIDVGTTGAKAVLIDEDVRVVAEATSEYPLSTPRPLWSEQDPQAWWEGTIGSVGAVMREAGIDGGAIGAVGLTGQMHGLVLLDESGEPLRPAILWNDQRTEAECAAIDELVGRDAVVEINGKPALTGFTAPKILWVRRHEPAIFARTASFLLPKDYVRFRLTGARQTDVADASGTLLFDVAGRCWSDRMLDALEIPKHRLPEVFESAEPSARISDAGAAAIGLPAGTPVVAGAGDQAAEAIGCGVVDEGQVSVTIGTSGVVFAATRTCRRDGAARLHTFCHAAPDRWHLMGVMLSAGGSLRWFRDTLGGDEVARAAALDADPYELIIASAARAPAGSDGLLFLPYLTGERSPHPDPRARGAFVGLTLRHDRSHLARAVIEGVTFGLMDSLVLLRELGVEVSTVRVSGGGSRSATWRQILADVFRAEIVTLESARGAAYGAALLAGVGAGALPSPAEEGGAIVAAAETRSPGADAGIYESMYERYRALYPALATEFHAISSLADGEPPESLTRRGGRRDHEGVIATPHRAIAVGRGERDYP